MNGFLWIDGQQMPTPRRCPITVYDMDAAESGRAENGYMHRKRVRTGLLVLDAAWEHLTAEEAQRILNAVSSAAFQATVLLPGGKSTRKMYAGDRNIEPDFHGGGREERWNISVRLTEY